MHLDEMTKKEGTAVVNVRLTGDDAEAWRKLLAAIRAEVDLPALSESDVARKAIREAAQSRRLIEKRKV